MRPSGDCGIFMGIDLDCGDFVQIRSGSILNGKPGNYGALGRDDICSPASLELAAESGVTCRYVTPLAGLGSYANVKYAPGCTDVKYANVRKNIPTIVVIFSAGGIDITILLNNLKLQRASAIVWAGYPGAEGGHAIADVLRKGKGKIEEKADDRVNDAPALKKADMHGVNRCLDVGVSIGLCFFLGNVVAVSIIPDFGNASGVTSVNTISGILATIYNPSLHDMQVYGIVVTIPLVARMIADQE
ncbi:hypothetical protein IFM89_029734 [Coptis chinensis]|uniref:Glycoside hydrolase family 3 C-terminal domain-containing protein n=1 Tax=Coptis chinensis TaxID=261450 RepID=A0A835I4V7_9MAGN|nr:hypothetical protein IFM89_029734 [Coptis chinensis]